MRRELLEEEGGGASGGSRARCIQEQSTVRELQVEEEGEVENQVMLKEGAIEVSLASLIYGDRSKVNVFPGGEQHSATAGQSAGRKCCSDYLHSLSLYLSISPTQLG